MIATLNLRVKRNRTPHIPHGNGKGDDKPETADRVAAFVNPGFGNVGTFDGGGEQNCDKLDPVVFSPFQEDSGRGEATNPVYTEFGMTKISPTKTINTDGAIGGSDAKKAASNKNAFQYEITGKLPKKKPVSKDDKAEEKSDYIWLVSDNTSEKNA